MGEVILTMKDIDKSFPGVHALDHVNFEVKRGEVHALMATGDTAGVAMLAVIMAAAGFAAVVTNSRVRKER